jgi:DNA polymerase alpha-associated DNA helicase A
LKRYVIYPIAIASELSVWIQVCWIPILKAKKLILAGDNLQLPPTVKSIDKKNSKSQRKVSAKAAGKSTSKGKPTDAKALGKAKATPPPAPVTFPTSDGEEDDDTSDDDNGDDETEPPPPSKPTGGKIKEPRQLGILHPSKSLEITLFDRMEKMWGEDIKQMLTVQYRCVAFVPVSTVLLLRRYNCGITLMRNVTHGRMNAKICDFPSKTLYSSRLISDGSVACHLLSDLPDLPNATDAKDTLGHEVVFFDTAGCEFFERTDGGGEAEAPLAVGDEGSKCNVNEAEVVRKWVEELVSGPS